MNSSHHASEYDNWYRVSPETEYLISDVEELVNNNFREFLGEAPFKIKANGYKPELLHGEKPSGIDLLEADFLMDVGSFDREFVAIDMLIDFPLRSGSENPWNIEVKWSDGLQIRLALVDKLPILLVEESKENGHTLHSEILHPEVMAEYVEKLGLPHSIWSEDIKELTRDLYSCPEFFMTQSATRIVDPYTTVELIHDAQMRQDIDDRKQLVQELLIHIDHLEQDTPTTDPDELALMPHMRYRNMLRFDHDDTNGLWQYKGAYSGKLGVGEFIDEVVQVDPKLGVPGSKVLEKVLHGLET